jgi:hypothetical protein
MRLVKGVGKVLVSPLAAAAGLFNKPKAPAPTPVATRDDVLARRAAEDRISRRRGGLVDLMTGTGGAEAPAAPAAGVKALLGS